MIDSGSGPGDGHIAEKLVADFTGTAPQTAGRSIARAAR